MKKKSFQNHGYYLQNAGFLKKSAACPGVITGCQDTDATKVIGRTT